MYLAINIIVHNHSVTYNITMKMWNPTLLLLFASLLLFDRSGCSASKVIVLSNECGVTGGNSGDGEFFHPGDSFSGDGNGSRLLHLRIVQRHSLLHCKVTSHTIIILGSGNYSIDEFILIQGVTNFTLKADFKVMTIQCTGNTGLAFINVSQLSILNIVIDGCGFYGKRSENTVDILEDIVNIFPRLCQLQCCSDIVKI